MSRYSERSKVDIIDTLQVGCPLPKRLNLPFAHWSVPASNVQEVDNQPGMHCIDSALACASVKWRNKERQSEVG